MSTGRLRRAVAPATFGRLRDAIGANVSLALHTVKKCHVPTPAALAGGDPTRAGVRDSAAMNERRPIRSEEPERPSHPTRKAVLLMIGVVVLLVLISIL